MRRDIELVVTDLDGTVWDHGERMHDETLAALHELRARDVPLLVATGRRLASAASTLAEHELSLPMVVLDGALGRDLATGERFHDAPFDQQAAHAVLAAFERADIRPCAYVDRVRPQGRNGAVRFAGTEVVIGERCSTHPRHIAHVGDLLGRGDLVELIRRTPVYGFGVVGVERVRLDAVLAEIGDEATGVVTPVPDSLDSLGQGLAMLVVRPAAVSKWAGVLAWCAARGLDDRRVLAIGDGDNDLELLEGAATSCVIADGTPSALELADHVLDPPALAGWRGVLDLL